MILAVVVRCFVLALELDTNGKIVAAVAAAIARCAGVPGALGERHELHQLAIAPDQKVCGDFDAAYRLEVRVRVPVEGIAEQCLDLRSPELTGRQADAVQDQQLGCRVRGTRIAVRAGHEAGWCQASTGSVDDDVAPLTHIGHDREVMSTRLLVSAALGNGADVELDGDRAHYLSRVLRARVGDRIFVFDGSGQEWPAEIVSMSKAGVRLSLGDGTNPGTESALRIHLVQGVSRGERMDFVVQKATELGVKRITPVLTDYGVVKLTGDRAAKRQAHWQSVANSASEQCGRTRPPKVDAPLPLKHWFGQKPAAVDTELVLIPGATTPLTAIAAPETKVCVLIGPEGGFSDTEIDDAAVSGFEAVSLGPRVLRTETAAVAAVAMMQAVWSKTG